MICVHAHPSEIEKMGASALSHLVVAQMARIEQLEFLVAKLKRAQFGPKSEKLAVNEDATDAMLEWQRDRGSADCADRAA